MFKSCKWICEYGGKKQPRSIKCVKCVDSNASNSTKSDFVYENDTNAASRYSRIRGHARTIVKRSDKFNNTCNVCGCTKHVEVCHLKSIKEFSDDAKISEINAVSNLIQLCRNCHWEFDNGLIMI